MGGGAGVGREKPEKRSLGSAKEWKYFPTGSAADSLPSVHEMQVGPLGREDPQRREWQPTPVFLPG